MTPRRSARLVLILALAAVTAEGAGPSAPKVGSWAVYAWTSTLAQPTIVLVQQPGPGGQVTWSVAQESSPPAPIFVTYGVVRADTRTYTLQIVTQEQKDGPPLSITQVTVDQKSGKSVRSVIQRPKGLIETPESALRPLREADVKGAREEVTVKAGRFPAVRGTAQGAEVWVSDRVVSLGLVKAVWPSGTMELVESAESGAKDLLAAGK